MVASKKQLKNANTGTIFVILIFGIFFVIFVFGVIKEYSFYKNAEKVDGLIYNVTTSTRHTKQGTRMTSYKYYVNYTTLDGQKFNNIQAKYDGGLSGTQYIGKYTTVYYNKFNPSEVGLKGFSIDIAYMIVVVIFGAIVGSMLYLRVKGSKKLKQIDFLMNNGFRGTAQITNITSKKSGKNKIYIIDCVAVHPFTNQQFYSSGKVQHIKNLSVNSQLDAYFDPQESEIYFIDLD